MQPAPRILALSPVGPNDLLRWIEWLERVVGLGFTTIALLYPGETSDQAALATLTAAAHRAGLRVMAAIVPEPGGPAARIEALRTAGIDDFLAVTAHHLPARDWRLLTDAAHAAAPGSLFAAETLGRDLAETLALRDAGFDLLFNSVCWWDGREAWFLDQQAQTCGIAPSLGFPDLPGLRDAPAIDDPADRRRRLLAAAALSTALLVPASWLGRDDALIAEVNRLKALLPSLNEESRLVRLATHDEPVTAVLRGAKTAGDATLVLTNTDRSTARAVDLDGLIGTIPGTALDIRDVTPGLPESLLPPSPLALGPGEIRLVRLLRDGERRFPGPDLPPPPELPTRMVIEHVTPELDGGRFPVKRVAGDMLEVEADVFRDGHDKLAAALWLSEQGDAAWRIAPMQFVDNDRWRGRIALERIGDTRFAVAAWTDHFESWRDEVQKKRAAGRPLELELIEGCDLIEQAAARAKGPDEARLRAVLATAAPLPPDERAAFLLSARVAHAMARVPDHADLTLQAPLGRVTVDRPAARFAAWYEMFPRSQGTDPTRAASFADCAMRLPEIRAQGFDVVYLVPIHPIGRINRKGRNNGTTALPGEPGSPYAIGSDAGGHDAIDPDLGTLEEFRTFLDAVHTHGMELAMDFAVQCAPDHPWLAQHPQWFKRRPDGSIKFAENPPKKYEDIVNVNFDQEDWRGLWAALRDVVRFWVDEGVRIFRVDNPHTKPVVFWEWLIAEIRATHPDVLFLSEAFTRPKMMKRLAKIGFSQSYSYFTWRNEKWEITEYLTELTRTEAVEYYRPNFFPTTPDILPWYLQTSGRAGFVIRLVLAATLSPLYGMYNGYELCEAEAVPGKEEFLNSEKYQYKVWDWDRPGHIKAEIAALNRLRRESPALHLFENLRFHEANHDAVLFYSKVTPDRSDRVLVAVTLDPKRLVRAEIVFPLDHLGLRADGTFETEDLFTGERRRWTGARHWILLDPATYPAMILRVRPSGAPS